METGWSGWSLRTREDIIRGGAIGKKNESFQARHKSEIERLLIALVVGFS